MPQMSVLAAPPPPPPDAMPEAPEPPGSMPRLSMSLPTEKQAGAPKGLQIRVAEGQTKGGKPVVKGLKPGKPPAPFRKKSKLGPVAKVGIGVLVLAVTVAVFFFYRIFFPAPAQVVVIKSAPIARPAPKLPMADVLAKAAAAKLAASGESALAASRAAAQARVDALAAAQDAPTPVPTSINDASQSVMAQADLTTDVKVNNTQIQAAPAASEAFRTFVANASIGGVFQGTPSRAIVNGRIVREGQVIDNQLGVMFDRIDAAKKMIYFKDSTSAEVSKNY
jgi:hypothetical protein